MATLAIRLGLVRRREHILGAGVTEIVELAHVVEVPAHRGREVGVGNLLRREMGMGPGGLGAARSVGGAAERDSPSFPIRNSPSLTVANGGAFSSPPSSVGRMRFVKNGLWDWS